MGEVHWRFRPKVSVLVAAWNEAAIIQEHIASFLRLRYAPKELVLCAGGDDGTFGLAYQYIGKQVTVIKQHLGEGKQRALRRTLALADGEVILLTDADCLFADESFEKVLAPVINEDEVVATGTIQPLPQQRSSPFILHRWFNEVWTAFHTCHKRRYVTGLMGANTAIHRDVLGSVGGFEMDVPSGTDYHLAKVLLEHGYRIRYVPESAVYTLYADSFVSYCRQQSRWLRNVVTHGLRFGAYDEVARGLLPSFLGVFMLIGTSLALGTGTSRWVEHRFPWIRALRVMWGFVWVHVLLRRLWYIRFAERVTRERFPKFGYIALPFYILEDFVVWSWALLQYPFKSRRLQW